MVLVDGFRFGKDATSALRQKALPLHGFLVFLAPGGKITAPAARVWRVPGNYRCNSMSPGRHDWLNQGSSGP